MGVLGQTVVDQRNSRTKIMVVDLVSIHQNKGL